MTVIVECEVCGPQEPPKVHTICHAIPHLRSDGCGHPIADHSATLKCRTCGVDCGIDATSMVEHFLRS